MSVDSIEEVVFNVVRRYPNMVFGAQFSREITPPSSTSSYVTDSHTNAFVVAVIKYARRQVRVELRA